MIRLLMAATAIALIVPAALAAELNGNYRLSQTPTALADFRIALIKFESKDGKTTATVIDTLATTIKGKDPVKRSVKVIDVKLTGDTLEIKLVDGQQNQTFTATIKDTDVIRGAYGDDSRIVRATLTKQDGDELKVMTAAERPKEPEQQAALRRCRPQRFNCKCKRNVRWIPMKRPT